mgnify:CR=1 FL=1
MEPWTVVVIPELWGTDFLVAVPIENLQTEDGHKKVQAWIDKLSNLPANEEQ